MKRLYRSKTDRTALGLIGGLGEYFNVDAVILRLAWIFVTVMTGILPGAIVYVISALIVPEAPSQKVDVKPTAKAEAKQEPKA